MSIASPPWFIEAGRLKGVVEGAGAKNNPTILGWAQKLGGWIAKFYKADSTAWCGLFQAHCMSVGLPGEKLPDNPLGALNWAKFGIELGRPSPGAILVFNRPGAGLGHVGQYVAEAGDSYLVRGGNQGDKVCDEWIAKERCVAIRWPKSYPIPVEGRVVIARSGKLSTNEA